MKTVLLCFLMLSGVLFGAPDHQIIIMRHGEAEHNLTNTYNSNPFSPLYTVSNLTSLGEEEVRHVAKKLEKLGFNADNISQVYVSPLPRVLQTSDILAESGLYPRSKVTLDLRLTETQFAGLEGAVEISDPKILKRMFKEYHVETDEHVNDRLIAFYKDVQHDNPCGNVLVITHAYNYQKLMNIIAKTAVGIPDNVAFQIKPL